MFTLRESAGIYEAVDDAGRALQLVDDTGKDGAQLQWSDDREDSSMQQFMASNFFIHNM